MVTKAKKIKSKKGSIIAIGFDLSLSSIAGCAKAKDTTLDKTLGPVWSSTRWTKEVSHFEKLKILSGAHEFIFDLENQLASMIRSLDDIHIGVEELPARVMNSSRYREQAELFGAFVGGLLKFGYKNIYPVNVKQWQAMVANDLDMKANKDFTKFHIAEWVEEVYDVAWTPLIRTAKGLIAKPESSNAKAEQPDDRVDATGIMEWVWESKLNN